MNWTGNNTLRVLSFVAESSTETSGGVKELKALLPRTEESPKTQNCLKYDGEFGGGCVSISKICTSPLAIWAIIVGWKPVLVKGVADPRLDILFTLIGNMDISWLM